MAPNPIPTRITGPMWRLWEECERAIPGVRLGGIYANKSGYHNSRAANQSNWPGNYSVRLSDDRAGPADKAAALDLTMSDAQMRLRTGYLYTSAMTAGDDRLRWLREFIGTRDSKRVYCRISDSGGLGSRRGRDDWARDRSHLWHIHLSIHRGFVDDWGALAGVLSVLRGEPPTKEDDMSWDEKLPRRPWVQETWPHLSDKAPAGTTLSAVYGFARRASDRTGELLAGQAAILARLDGSDDGATRKAIRAELEAHRAELLATVRAELGEVLEQRAELGADTVVDELARRLAP